MNLSVPSTFRFLICLAAIGINPLPFLSFQGGYQKKKEKGSIPSMVEENRELSYKRNIINV